MKKRLTGQMSIQHIQDGVVYKIETNVSSIKKDKLNNKITPSKIIINGSRKMGEDPIVMQAGYFKIYEQIDGSDGVPGAYAIKYSSTSSETLVEYSPLYSASRLKIEFYENNAFTVKLDEKTIEVYSDGITMYQWVMYADSITGTGISPVSTGKRFMGIANNKTTATASNNPAEYTWSPLYDNVKIGAKNLLLLSNEAKNTTSYLVAQYNMTEKMKANDDYTFTVRGTLAAGQTGWAIYLSGSATANKLADLPYQAGLATYSVSFKGKDVGAGSDYIALYSVPSNTSSSTVAWVQLENGNVATGWNMAPEEVITQFGELDGAVNGLTGTTIPSLQNKMLDEAEKSSIRAKMTTVESEKKDIDAACAGLVANTKLLTKTTITTPKTAYDTSYNNMVTALNNVLNVTSGNIISAALLTEVTTKMSDYQAKILTLRTAMQTAQQAIEAKITSDANTALSTQLQNYVTQVSYGQDLITIQNQLDGSITTHFGNIEPTILNTPASEWTTVVLKDTHLGDLYYDNVTGFAYRFAKNGEVYSWIRILDSDITLALENASKAQDTADAKRRSFYTTPTPPYDLGDLWVQGTSGELMRCSTAKPTGGAYAASDWTRAVKYTDDTAVNALEFGGRNLVRLQNVRLSGGATQTSFDEATNTWTLSVPTGSTRAGLGITGTTVRIPYGRTYICSMEIFSPYATTFSFDINNYPVSGGTWSGNDHDNVGLRANGSTTVAANQWVKVWFRYVNTHASNTGKVDLYDGSDFGIPNSTGSTQTIKIRNLQGELGTKPSDWTPAPEDVAQDIADVSTSVTNLQNLTNTTFKDGLIETAEAQAISEHLKVLAKENGDLVNQYNTLNAHTRLLGTAKTNLGTANTNYGASYTTLVSSINAAIADDRTSAAEKTDVDTKFMDYATKLRALTKALVDAQASISDQLAKDAANAIQVGGRNWFKKTTSISTLVGTVSTSKNSLNGFTSTVSAANYSIRIGNVLTENGTYTFSGYVTCTVAGTVQVDFADNAFGSFSVSTTRTKFSVTGTITNYTSGVFHFIDLSGVPAGTYTFEDVMVEKGNKATDWNPAPEDMVQTINSFRESLDASRSIRMGMKIGYGAFATQNATSIYFCGLQRNPETFVEEMVDTDGSIWDFTTKQSIVVAKQVMSLSGLTAGTKGYVVWDGTTAVLWFIHYEKIVNAQGVATSERWIKRNVGKVGDNTVYVPSDNTYFLGEIEI